MEPLDAEEIADFLRLRPRRRAGQRAEHQKQTKNPSCGPTHEKYLLTKASSWTSGGALVFYGKFHASKRPPGATKRAGSQIWDPAPVGDGQASGVIGNAGRLPVYDLAVVTLDAEQVTDLGVDRLGGGAGHGGDDQSETQKPQCYFLHDENLLMNPVPDIGT
jgi:hypothetical protein